MEVKMTECPQGHYYNAAIHSSCPVCGAGGAQPVGATTPVGGASSGNFPHTTPPGGAVGYNAGPAGGMGNPTMPVNNRDASGPVTPFDVPTQAGGDLAADGQLEPVVGWLVCIEGPVRGVDFRIHAGYNYIGREEGDIHIHNDNQISRQKHAVISFYPKRQTFYVGPAEGRNIIELNDEPVFNAMEMKSYDVLTIGTTKLMLVALCGEHFRWNGEAGNE